MLKTKYDVLVRNGMERFIVVPEKDFEALREQLEDEADYRVIEESKKRNAGRPLVPLEQVKRELGLSKRRKKRKALRGQRGALPTAGRAESTMCGHFPQRGKRHGWGQGRSPSGGDPSLSKLVRPHLGPAICSILPVPPRVGLLTPARDARREYAHFAVTYSISPALGTRPASAPSFSKRVIASRPRGP